MRSFIGLDLFDHNVPFDNTTPIYLINLPWKLGLGLGLDLKLHYFSIFARRIKKTSTFSSANFKEGNIVEKNVTIRSTAKRFIYSMSVYE